MQSRVTSRFWCFLRPWMSLATLALSMLGVGAPARVLAEEPVLSATHQLDESNMGLATLLGPQLAVSGPPTAFAVQLQFWRALDAQWSIYGSLGLAVSGEAEFADDNGNRAQFGSTSAPSISAGVRYLLDAGQLPVQFFGRGGLLVSVLSSGEVIGSMFGPELAAGLSYPLFDGLEVLAESVLALGYASYEPSAAGLGLTFGLGIGAQLRF